MMLPLLLLLLLLTLLEDHIIAIAATAAGGQPCCYSRPCQAATATATISDGILRSPLLSPCYATVTSQP
jgi:hypothetical protein